MIKKPVFILSLCVLLALCLTACSTDKMESAVSSNTSRLESDAGNTASKLESDVSDGVSDLESKVEDGMSRLEEGNLDSDLADDGVVNDSDNNSHNSAGENWNDGNNSNNSNNNNSDYNEEGEDENSRARAIMDPDLGGGRYGMTSGENTSSNSSALANGGDNLAGGESSREPRNR